MKNIQYPAPKQEYKVLVRCFTFNHSKYIEDALNGFAMQQTDFPFVCLVMDDASTDGEQEVIKEWMKRECDMSRAETIDIPTSVVIIVPHKTNVSCSFAFYLLKQNLYGTGDKKMNHVYPWREKCEYEALCEGDDYWIDPLKLQKQVDFLEENPEYSMCCSDAIVESPKGNLNWTRYSKNGTIPTEDMILGGGLFVQTATLLMRKSLLMEGYPRCAQLCHVGDYPLQIYAVLKGKVFWFAEKHAVYRYQSASSWTRRINNEDLDKLIIGWRSEIDMLKGMDTLSNKKYTDAFTKVEVNYILERMANKNFDSIQIYKSFQDVISFFTPLQKLDVLLIKAGCKSWVRMRMKIVSLISKL